MRHRIVVETLDGLEGQERCDLVVDIGQAVVSRVIGSFMMGIPPEDDAMGAKMMNATLGASDPDLNPDGVEDGRHASRLGLPQCGYKPYKAGGRSPVPAFVKASV